MEWLEGRPPAAILTSAVVLVGLIALAAATTRAEIRYSFFYLIPVSLVSWFVGQRAGALLAAACALVWLLANALEAGWSVSSEKTLYANGLLLATFFLATALLLSALRAALDQATALARTDALTGLENRLAFEDRANLEIRRAERFDRPLTVALFDLDDFKSINDRQGHAAGDRVLVLLADGLRNGLRSIDLVARLGGDEFVVLLPETDSAAARVAFTNLLDQTRDLLQQRAISVGISVGVVTFGQAPDSVSRMLKAADDLMYRAKRGGKNRIEFDLAEGSSRKKP